MKQRDVGIFIGVSEDCITNWENNRSTPMIHSMPKIIEFLGYNPTELVNSDLSGQIKTYRIRLGLSHKKLGKMLGVDGSTVGAWEKFGYISRRNVLCLSKLIPLKNNTNKFK